MHQKLNGLYEQTFGFAVVKYISLTSIPKSILNIYSSTLVLLLILFFNIIVVSFFAILKEQQANNKPHQYSTDVIALLVRGDERDCD